MLMDLFNYVRHRSAQNLLTLFCKEDLDILNLENLCFSKCIVLKMIRFSKICSKFIAT